MVSRLLSGLKCWLLKCLLLERFVIIEGQDCSFIYISIPIHVSPAFPLVSSMIRLQEPRKTGI